MQVSRTADFDSLQDEHPQRHLVGPLIAAVDEQQHRVDGTAFLIGPGWAMTARHVLEEYVASIQGIFCSSKRGDTSETRVQTAFHTHLLLRRVDGKLQLFSALKMYFVGSGDIALLRLGAPDGFDWAPFGPYPTLNLLPPALHSRIQAIGLPSSATASETSGAIQVHTWPRAALGVVDDVHEQQRDPLTLPFPCFQCSARLDGGMSGGPVFNDAGEVCGVIVKSYALPEEERPIGYAATLWPSTIIPFSDLPPIGNDKLRFYDLLRRKDVNAANVDRIAIELEADGRPRVSVLP